MQYSSNGGINWTWYLGYELIEAKTGETKVKILLYDRLHRYDSYQGSNNHPKTSGFCDLIEGKNRIVRRVRLNNKDVYKVANPKYIFDYPKFK